ncbi:C-C motif chemokine 19b [Colossoma macropomum]|uniref:C-C motif chemokine 19b n=1 Tax=Colossoma macropomum TaxID=42526 RepID=UPI001863CFD5|nr:C-C motif chemokine 19b [Colossoma macropomum]
MVSNSMTAHTTVLLLLLLVFCGWCYAVAEGEDCCLSTLDKTIPHKMVKSFYLQTVDKGCNVSATVFVTKKGRKLCAPPLTKSDWVRKLTDRLKKTPKRKSKGKKQ